MCAGGTAQRSDVRPGWGTCTVHVSDALEGRVGEERDIYIIISWYTDFKICELVSVR